MNKATVRYRFSAMDTTKEKVLTAASVDVEEDESYTFVYCYAEDNRRGGVTEQWQTRTANVLDVHLETVPAEKRA